ncbi:hypothetical protein P154DRAFT_582348 [Amniculicola lignicola CBS 123094]|uniref:Uncharacterized protein n=1 Tax=Amniculicola lignicola CBS 123094 TaxID=1392246 RepID=A0A6A5W3Z7_9PLEO|nr:hypothetical protein P154DRAFT_582348 [Amniculicola lignicola CBS 123094]
MAPAAAQIQYAACDIWAQPPPCCNMAAEQQLRFLLSFPRVECTLAHDPSSQDMSGSNGGDLLIMATHTASCQPRAGTRDFRDWPKLSKQAFNWSLDPCLSMSRISLLLCFSNPTVIATLHQSLEAYLPSKMLVQHLPVYVRSPLQGIEIDTRGGAPD